MVEIRAYGGRTESTAKVLIRQTSALLDAMEYTTPEIAIEAWRLAQNMLVAAVTDLGHSIKNLEDLESGTE